MKKKVQLKWNLLKKLLDTIAISSFESKINKIVLNNLNPLLYTSHITPLGNLLLKSKSKKKKRIVVCSHSDEVGFLISNVTSNGMAKVVSIGGMLVHAIYGSQFIFQTISDKKIIGVFKQPTIHELRVSNTNVRRRSKWRKWLETIHSNPFNAYFDKQNHIIDFGYKSKDNLDKIGLTIGCQGTFATKAKIIGSKRIISKALDNRIGTYLNLIGSLNQHENQYFAIDRIFGVREEIGAIAFTTALDNLKYDAAIVLDVSPTREDNKMGLLGNGVLKRIADATHITNRKLIEHFEIVAKKYSIKIQPYVSLGGTDGGNINQFGKGIPIIPLNIVARNLHTGISICDINDLLEANRMLFALEKEINPNWFKI